MCSVCQEGGPSEPRAVGRWIFALQQRFQPTLANPRTRGQGASLWPCVAAGRPALHMAASESLLPKVPAWGCRAMKGQTRCRCLRGCSLSPPYPSPRAFWQLVDPFFKMLLMQGVNLQGRLMAKKAAASKRSAVAAGSSPDGAPPADEQPGPSCSVPPTDRPVRVYADGASCVVGTFKSCRHAGLQLGHALTRLGQQQPGRNVQHACSAAAPLTWPLPHNYASAAGVFDLFHFGHARALEQAKLRCACMFPGSTAASDRRSACCREPASCAAGCACLPMTASQDGACRSGSAGG